MNIAIEKLKDFSIVFSIRPKSMTSCKNIPKMSDYIGLSVDTTIIEDKI